MFNSRVPIVLLAAVAVLLFVRHMIFISTLTPISGGFSFPGFEVIGLFLMAGLMVVLQRRQS